MVSHITKDQSDERRKKLPPFHELFVCLAARDLSYAPSHRQDNYTNIGALAGTRNS